MTRPERSIATLALATLTACAADDPEQIRADFQRLTAEARALVRAGPCQAVSDCRSVAVGAKACGGPREYWVYCRSATAEEADLVGKLEAAARLEQAYNQMIDAVSTCEAMLPPELELVGGECRAQ